MFSNTGEAMKRIPFRIILLGFLILALGLLISAPTAYTQGDQALREGKAIASVATELIGYYTGVTNAWDVANKLAEALGWIKPGPTINQQFQALHDYITLGFAGVSWSETNANLGVVFSNAQTAFDNLKMGYTIKESGNEDFWSAEAVNFMISGPGENAVFYRVYSDKYDGDFRLFMSGCEVCWVTKDEYRSFLDPVPGTNLVYDWRLALPVLMTVIAYRLQIIAAMDPNFRTDGKYWSKLNAYRDALIGHYNKIVAGIRCHDECGEVHSWSRVPSGAGWAKTPDGRRSAIYDALPLHELRAIIDTLYLYTRAPQPDLTQSYHRLPWFRFDANYCLTVDRNPNRPLTQAIMSSCLGIHSQQWVYDRKSGTVRNSGSVADPASGYCLGVNLESNGNASLRGAFGVSVSACSGEKSQQWTYDTEGMVLRTAYGVALYIDDNSLVAYIKWYTGSSQFWWQADESIPGVPPFSDTLAPGEKMYKGQSRVSKNNQYELVLQTDGNLVLYRKVLADPALPGERAVALWASNTNGKTVDYVNMQNDGNLVIYWVPIVFGARPVAIWASGTNGWPESHLIVQDDGNVVIYQQTTPIWATHTNQ